MSKLKSHAEIQVAVFYIESSGIQYEAMAYVTLNLCHEVESVRFSIIEAFDEAGESIEIEIDKNIMDILTAKAARKAFEKVESVDFEMEVERE